VHRYDNDSSSHVCLVAVKDAVLDFKISAPQGPRA
jgi:hypothetical protein